MTKRLDAPSAALSRAWNRLGKSPAGRWLFSRMVGRMAPFSATIRATVDDLGPGHARIVMRERRALQNHLGSVHAIALLNLGELTTGLATLMGTPAGVRGILLRLEAEYVKKARGVLTAECTCEVPAVSSPVDFVVSAEVRDAGGDTVTIVRATWRLDRAM